MVLPIPGAQWPPHMGMPAATQPQVQPQVPPQVQVQVQPQPSMGSSNLAKMTQMARSTPQLDDNPDGRDRDRSRDKLHHLQTSRDGLVSQVSLQLLVLKTKTFSL